MKRYALIVAGGSGSRMNAPVPKQFLELNGRSILWHTINAFKEAFSDINIILVLPKDWLREGESLKTFFPSLNILVKAGGATRFHSVRNGLEMVNDEDSLVFVHDGVRCLVTPQLIYKTEAVAREKGNAIPALTATDSIRITEGDKNKLVERTRVKIVQTPQVFLTSILKRAFNRDYDERFTDEASVAEMNGIDINLVEGEESNFKITRPTDLLLAAAILEQRESGFEPSDDLGKTV